jgi:threonine synthase
VITYTDTRGQTERPRTFSEVILEGIAPGGGLFVPQALPALDLADITALAAAPYHGRAARVYEAFGLDIPAASIRAISRAAYGRNFDDKAVAPVRRVGDRFVLELWHGPTLAFKDMALQCMPLFFSEALEMAHASGRSTLDYLILVATSGDTGVAALNGYADRPHTRIVVYYPDAGVSAVQERQMITQPGGNLSVFRLDGDFDACQSAVKATFDDGDFAGLLAERHNLALSSANSINWGRLLPQVVYYISAYAEMVAGGHLRAGDPLDITVPTGNFGNILAAYYAKRCGVPIGRLFCASNANKVLSDFIASGDYDISDRTLIKTPSPSMDILISSNLERLLYDLSSEPGVQPDAAAVTRWMAELKGWKRFSIDPATRARMQNLLTGEWVDNETCLRTIGDVYTEHQYLLDPHTAVAWKVAGDMTGSAPMLIVSTAHWSKFAADVYRALTGVPPDQPLPTATFAATGGDSMEPDEGAPADAGGTDELALLDRIVELAPGAGVPPQLRAVRERPVRFRDRVAGGKEALEESLLRWLSSSAS